jgi:uracil-DNA glycosylase family 4
MVNGWWWRCGNSAPCKACQEREGQFFPLSVPFQQLHDNCVCYPELSEVEDPEYSEMLPEEEIPGLQRISFETNEPAAEVPQIGDEDLKFIMPLSPGAGLGEMRQIPTFQKDVNPMKYFSSFDELWAHCQPALEGGSELYVEKAGQKRAFATRRELSILDRWAGGATIVTGGAERAVLLKAEIQPYGRENAKAVFVAASPNRIEVARGVPLAGEGRRFFRKAYLEPAGLRDEETAFLYLVPRVLKRAPTADEMAAWRPWLTRQLQDLNPNLVVGLGKQAGEALGELADLTMPHPHAVLRHGDSGEVSRKTSHLRQALAARGLNNCGCNKSIVGTEIRCSIFKADVERRLVYSVIAESDIKDAQGDVMSAETIENMAHDYMLKSRKFDDRHNWRAVDAAIVESWIQRVDTVLLGEVIKAISWVVGVKVFADHIWQKVLSGEYQAFSIGGRGVRVPRVRFG